MLTALLVVALAQAPALGKVQRKPNVAFRMLPGGGGSLDCAGQVQGSWGETITFTRATDQACTKGDGTLVTMASGSPAVEPAGYLSEQASTNLALRSQAFDNATWTKVGAGSSAAPTVTADSADCGNAPDGTQTAEKVVFAAIDADANTDATVLRQGITYTAAAYSHSFYLKTIAGTAVLYVGASGANFETKASITTTWQRFASENKTMTAAARNLDVGLNSFETNQLADLPQPEQTVCLWQAQSELLSHASSPIVTAGTTVTRNVTVATVPKPATIAVNYLLQSEDISTSWTCNAGVCSQTLNGWDFGSGATGDEIIDNDATNAEDRHQTFSTTGQGNFTCSAYMQAGTAGTTTDIGMIRLVSVGGVGSQTCLFTGLTSTTERKSCTVNITAAGTGVLCRVGQTTDGTVTGSVRVGGVQLNTGSAPEAYVATTTTTKTQGEGCAHVCVTPHWTGNNPYSAASALINARDDNTARLGFVVLANDQYGVRHGATDVVVAAGFTAGVTKCYRTQWSASAGTVVVRNLASGASASGAFTSFAAFSPKIYIGSAASTLSTPSARLSDIRLGASFGACQ